MSFIGGFKRPQGKTKRSQRALKKMEAKVFENPKSILFLRAANTSEVVTDAMNDLAHITKPHCKKLRKRNAFHAFEGMNHIEFLCFKNDCSLFCMGSDSKKRPHNLVLGRHFDFHALDIIELGILAMDPLTPEAVKGTGIASIGSKAFFVFEGSEFESEPFFIRLRNFFLDYFKGTTDPEILLEGVDRCILISLRSANGSDSVVPPSDDTVGTKPQAEKGNTVICFRHYAVKKTTSDVGICKSVDRVELTDIGPNFDFELRRVYFSSAPDFKKACRLPREVLAQYKGMHDNVTTDELGNLRGQLHIGKQDVSKLTLRRFNAYKKNRPVVAGAPAEQQDDAVEAEPAAGRKRSRLEQGDDEEKTKPRRRRAKRDNDEDFSPDVDI